MGPCLLYYRAGRCRIRLWRTRRHSSLDRADPVRRVPGADRSRLRRASGSGTIGSLDRRTKKLRRGRRKPAFLFAPDAASDDGDWRESEHAMISALSKFTLRLRLSDDEISLRAIQTPWRDTWQT